jgi:hypothetical protein
MGMFVYPHVTSAKGAICYCLDEFSKGRGARARVARLRDELVGLGATPDGNRLTTVFEQYLLPYGITEAAERERAVAHLRRHWFAPPSNEDAFFPNVPVASIYAEGVIRALDLALAGRRMVPFLAARVVQLNAWWLLGFPEGVQMLSLADVDPEPSQRSAAG